MAPLNNLTLREVARCGVSDLEPGARQTPYLPGDVGDSPGQSEHSAACGNASSPSLGAEGRQGSVRVHGAIVASRPNPSVTPRAARQLKQGSPLVYQQPLHDPRFTLCSWMTTSPGAGSESQPPWLLEGWKGVGERQ